MNYRRKNLVDDNLVTHAVIVMDESGSMACHKRSVVLVVDNLIKYLASRSQELGQETRVTVYTFSGGKPTAPGQVPDGVRCIIYDMDVLRLPSIADFYEPTGGTPLIDATYLAIQDLLMTPEKYGNHAYLMYVISDGEENASAKRPLELKQAIDRLPATWTLVGLVPGEREKRDMVYCGFPTDNVAAWDVNDAQGVEKLGQKIQAATDTYLVQRSTGVSHGTKTMFSTGDAAINAATVAATGILPLARSKYMLTHVPTIADKTWIRDFVQSTGKTYVIGKTFYQLTKREKIAAGKQLAILEKGTDKVYLGWDARQLLGLPDTEVTVVPEPNSKFLVFVQSTSVNRHLVSNTKLLILE